MADIKLIRRRLRNIRNIKREQYVIEQQIERLHEIATSVGGFSTEMHKITGYVQSKMENCIIQAIALEKKLENKRLALIGAYEIAESLLALLNKDEYGQRAVLRSIYLLCNTQERTAELLNYSIRQVRYLEWAGVNAIAQRERTNRRLATRK